MASIKLKMYKRDVRRDGTCGIYLQVIINRRKLDLGLDIQWPPNKFGDKGCSARTRDDHQVDAYNMIIRKCMSKANDILIDYRLRDLPIDVEIFKREYYSNLNKNNFLEYFKQKSFERWNKGLISDVTYKQEKTTLTKLAAFTKTTPYKDVIPFNTLHAQWGQELDLFLRKPPYNNKQNTLWSERKRIKTYLTMAESEGVAFIDPYKKFKVSQVKSRFKALSRSKYKILWDHYSNGYSTVQNESGQSVTIRLTPEKKAILRRFLFSCNTGLRISDLRVLTTQNFKDGKMTIQPKKTERYGTKVEAVPLNDMALLLLNDEIAESPNAKLFFRFTEQYGNRTLKAIAKDLQLDHDLHNHIGRSTFASLYDQAGGNHRSLMEYMGLNKMETLMKYVQSNNEVIQEGIDKMNAQSSKQ